MVKIILVNLRLLSLCSHPKHPNSNRLWAPDYATLVKKLANRQCAILVGENRWCSGKTVWKFPEVLVKCCGSGTLVKSVQEAGNFVVVRSCVGPEKQDGFGGNSSSPQPSTKVKW